MEFQLDVDAIVTLMGDDAAEALFDRYAELSFLIAVHPKSGMEILVIQAEDTVRNGQVSVWIELPVTTISNVHAAFACTAQRIREALFALLAQPTGEEWGKALLPAEPEPMDW